jgi:hypothetical protein
MGIRRGLAACGKKPNSKVKLVNGQPLLTKKGDLVEYGLKDLVMDIWNQPSPIRRNFQDKYNIDVYSKDFRHPVLHGGT